MSRSSLSPTLKPLTLVLSVMVLSFLSLAMNSLAFGSSFKAAGNYAVGKHPVSLAAGDFNRDGKIDLAVANSGSKTVSVLLGGGDGTFGQAADYAIGIVPKNIVVTDLNGDGRADIVVRDAGGSKVSVLLGRGDGGFMTHIEMSAGQLPGDLFRNLPAQSPYKSGTQTASVVFADFNGDGQVDEAVSMSGRNMVSVLVNVTGRDGIQDITGYSNLIVNGGFETGSNSPWYEGRDDCFGTCKTWGAGTVAPKLGLWDAGNVGNIEFRQDFAATDTSTIAAVIVWIRHPADAVPAAVDFFYADGSDNEYVAFVTDTGWDSFDLTADLSPGQLDGFSVFGYSGGTGIPISFLDGVALLASD
jgi:hypothetical protein